MYQNLILPPWFLALASSLAGFCYLIYTHDSEFWVNDRIILSAFIQCLCYHMYVATKVALGQVFSENCGFPCQSTLHLFLHNHLHYHPRLAQ
jgi:hypothetical protein